ncbi:hypothetical protein Fmac_011244 [Flemingia macrophylla]|uniref:Uncharacterized protein n=1 Tax=Flemingia macrophylla TaxID=520843 RepID=A0ABD1MMP3_9FABA
MKVSWKKNKKRCLPTLSHFIDLSFDHHQQHSNNEAEDGACVHHPHQTHATQLATEFQAQGDKLAMVRIIVTRIHVVLMGSVVICFVGKGKVE